jgi:hypothetical protein
MAASGAIFERLKEKQNLFAGKKPVIYKRNLWSRVAVSAILNNNTNNRWGFTPISLGFTHGGSFWPRSDGPLRFDLWGRRIPKNGLHK